MDLTLEKYMNLIETFDVGSGAMLEIILDRSSREISFNLTCRSDSGPLSRPFKLKSSFADPTKIWKGILKRLFLANWNPVCRVNWYAMTWVKTESVQSFEAEC